MILPNCSQRFGVREPVGGLEQHGQVVEAAGDVGMIGPKLGSSVANGSDINQNPYRPPIPYRLAMIGQWVRLFTQLTTFRTMTCFGESNGSAVLVTTRVFQAIP